MFHVWISLFELKLLGNVVIYEGKCFAVTEFVLDGADVRSVPSSYKMIVVSKGFGYSVVRKICWS